MLVRRIKRKFSKKEQKLEELSSMKNDLSALKDSLSMLEKEKEKLSTASSVEGFDVTSSFSLLNNRYDYVENQIGVLECSIKSLQSSIEQC